jgi:hypothetical protein
VHGLDRSIQSIQTIRESLRPQPFAFDAVGNFSSLRSPFKSRLALPSIVGSISLFEMVGPQYLL